MESLEAALARIAQLEAQLAKVTAELEALRPPPQAPTSPAPEVRATATSAILELTAGGPLGLRLAVPRNKTITIGRSDQATYELDDSRLSRKHCAIKLGEMLHVVDLDSQNGTSVNGDRIRDPVTLRVGDMITIGSVALAVRSLGVAST